MPQLAGKRAVVLGAAGPDNMGQAIARAFAAEGAKVLVSGRKEEPLKALAGEIDGYTALCDITRRDDVFAVAEAASAAMGGVDIAVNATGWGLLKPFLENTEEDIDRMTAVQFKGPFYFCQAMAGAMMNGEKQGGSIIQISSATATIMLEDHAAYMGTKAGTDHVIRCVANEFGRHNIRANSIAPGITETPMVKKASTVPGLMDAFAEAYPLGRVGTVDDIAAAAIFLARDDCFMTGQTLQVNGGLTLRRNPTNAELKTAVGKAKAEAAAQTADQDRKNA